VKSIADVIQRPAMPADARPDKANRVVTSTDKAPRTSKFSESQRFVIKKLYIIYLFVSTGRQEQTRNRKYDTYSSSQINFGVKAVKKSLFGRKCAHCHNTLK
jgi:hypothetical protein